MTDLIVRKAQETSFALLKIAAYIRRFELRQRIEKLSYHLLENISYQNPEVATNTITALRNFVLLGKNIYEIEPKNALILDRELEALHNEISRFSGTSESLDVSTLFSVNLPVHTKPEEGRVSQVKVKSSKPKTVLIPRETSSEWQFHIPEEILIKDSEVSEEPIPEAEEVNVAINNQAILPALALAMEGDNTANRTARLHEDYGEARQEKMIALIASSENRQMQLKDFIAAFPEISDRTIRYDLKKLTDSGKIVRQGSGGPANYYELRP